MSDTSLEGGRRLYGMAALAKPGQRLAGRQKGTPNKYNGDIKRMVVGALELVGGVQYLARQAEKNPVAFLGLVGRVLPLQVTGADGGALRIDIGIDRPPEVQETREEWIARRKAELVAIEPLAQQDVAIKH